MEKSIDRLIKILSQIVEYYEKHQFFYNQYKHGLSIALRPFGLFSDEQVEKDKKYGSMSSTVYAMDNLNFKNASKNNKHNLGALLIPNLTENVRPFIAPFQKENNLLRYVSSPQETDIESILTIAKKTKRCIHILITNILQVVNDNNPLKLRLPDEIESKVIEFIIPANKTKSILQ
jgi:hypothetical protein